MPLPRPDELSFGSLRSSKAEKKGGGEEVPIREVLLWVEMSRPLWQHLA